MAEIFKYIYRIIYIIILKRRNVKIAISSRFNRASMFEGYNVVHGNCIISNTSIGYASYIGQNCTLINCRIGRFCSIANNVDIIHSQHPTSIFVSSHPIFYSTNKQCGTSYVTKNLFNEQRTIDGKSAIIGHDVWIGANVKIIEGVRIGNGAIIAAGSYVVKDVPDYAIVGGIPAKVIKYRFTKEEIDNLLNIKWWNWDHKELNKHSKKFSDINTFLNYFNPKH